MSETQKRKAHNHKHHDEDVDEFVPDEEDMSEVSEYESVKGPALTFGTIDKTTTIRLFTTPLLVSFMVTVIALFMTLFYFVPLWDPVDHLDRIKFRIAMQDVGYQVNRNTTVNIGELFMQTILTKNETKDLFKWEFVTGLSARKYTYDSITSDVTHQKYWAGIIIPQNFTRDMLAAYTLGSAAVANGEYSNPVTYIRDQSLQYTTSTVIDRAFNAVIASVDVAVRKQLMANFKRAPDAPAKVVFNPFYLDSVTVHTIGVIGEYFAHYVPLVIIWICMMVTLWVTRSAFRSDYMIGNFAFTKHKKYMWYFINVFIAGFFVSLCISLFLDGLGVPIKEGTVSMLFLYWFTALVFAAFLNFLFALMSSPGLAIGTLFLIFQLVTSDGIYAAKTTTANFRGATPVFPFAHAVQLSRTLVLGTAMNNRALHFEIMFIWLVVTGVLAPILDYFDVGKKFSSKVLPVSLKGYYHFIQMI